MRPWIRKYRFYWTFAPGGRLNYEAYNVVPFKCTFLITFRNGILTIINNSLLKLLHEYYDIIPFNYSTNYMFKSFFQPMSTHQADMSTKIRLVKIDVAFVINCNTN